MDQQSGEQIMGRCSAHPDNPAVGVCRLCGAFVCSTCRTELPGRVICPKCLEAELTKAGESEAGSQRRFGIWSIAAAIAGFLVLLVFMVAVPETAPDIAFVVGDIAILAAGIAGLTLGILGVAGKATSSRGLCIVGVVLNAVLLVLYFFFVVVGLILLTG